MARSRSRSKKLRRSTKKCPEGQVAVRGRMSRRTKSRSRSHCRTKSPRNVLQCDPDKIKVKSRKTKSGKRSPAHCRTKAVRKACPPGTKKVKAFRTKKGSRVKSYCRKSKYGGSNVMAEEPLMLL
jgi:hypothetical protein